MDGKLNTTSKRECQKREPAGGKSYSGGERRFLARGREQENGLRNRGRRNEKTRRKRWTGGKFFWAVGRWRHTLGIEFKRKKTSQRRKREEDRTVRVLFTKRIKGELGEAAVGVWVGGI